MIVPPIPAMTTPEIMFGALVLVCFAAFAITLAGVHLYVNLPPRRQRERPVEGAAAYAASPAPAVKR